MDAPRAYRPYMPGYGVAGPDKGSGLLPWSWASARTNAVRNFRVTTPTRWVFGQGFDQGPESFPAAETLE